MDPLLAKEKTKTHLCAAYKRPVLDLKMSADWKWEDREASIVQTAVKRKPEEQYLCQT